MTVVLATAAATGEKSAPEAANRPLPVEDLGVPVSTMRRSGEFLVPRPEAIGWWFITSYNPVRTNELPLQVYIIDLETKEVKMSKRRPSGGLCHTINSKGLMGQDGKFYIGHYAKMGIWQFDPEDGSLDYLDFPKIEDRVLPFCMQMARDDGRIYMGTASAKAYLVEFDPESSKFRSFGVQGPALPAPRYVYSMAVGTKYVYSAAGKSPWYLVATDRETMVQKILIKDPEYLDVVGSGDNCLARVKTKAGPDQPTVTKRYRLRDGEAAEYVPSGPEKGAPRQKPAPKPEMLLTLARPNSEGEAQVWFRMPGKGWDHVDLEGIQTTPWKFNALKALPDGRLLGAPRAYEDFFVYDPKTNETKVVGKAPLSASTMQCIGGKVYIAGYPGTYLVEYDPGKPWTYFTTTPTLKEPPLSAPESNPRECHRLGEFTQTHHAVGSAVGADGFVYIGGHAERLHVGGGLVWWDPVNRKSGGLREPFLVQDCAGLAAARGGRLVVYSSRPVTDPRGKTPTPKEARLFVFDVTTKKVVDEIVPVPGLKSCGSVAAVGDRVFGVGLLAGKHLFYVIDLDSGKTVFSKALADATSNLKVGPDGKLYTFIGKTLSRIDPQALEFETLGSIEERGNIEFVGPDLYLTGYHLRRIRNVPGLERGRR